MPKPTTTTYVVLGLLALRRWSTYELARQMRRSTRYYWPRAESHLYEEPKKLVALGYATATREHVGRRPRTVYTITDEGRAALAEWLATPGGFPEVEFDGLVKVLFAEQGTRDQLLATLAAVRADAEAVRAHHAELAADLLATGGPFPDRLHVNALVFAFMWEQAQAVLRWARWAEEVVSTWPDTAPRPPEKGPLEEAARAAPARAWSDRTVSRWRTEVSGR